MRLAPISDWVPTPQIKKRVVPLKDKAEDEYVVDNDWTVEELCEAVDCASDTCI